MQIRPCVADDADALWRVLEPAIREGETLAMPRDMSRDDALAFWCSAERSVFVAHDESGVVGTSYVRPMQLGPGSHVANAGYVTLPASRGMGVARALCMHSLEHARSRGFRAMQFNFVVSTNERAVRLWQRCGFAIVGRLPGAYEHPRLGYVDALVMYQTLI